MKDKKFTQVSSTKGSEELLLWKDYSVYLYDEAIGRVYIGDFILELAKSDASTAENIVNFIEKFQEGKGLPLEMIKGKKPKIKEIALGNKLYEFREFSSCLKKHIRVYFSIDDKRKRVVFLSACFKSDNKKQDRDIKVAISRQKEYLRKQK